MISQHKIILHLLKRYGESTGAELRTYSDGKLHTGSVYNHLRILEDKGILISRMQDKPAHRGGILNRLYSINHDYTQPAHTDSE